jgi:hypothetical protein
MKIVTIQYQVELMDNKIWKRKYFLIDNFFTHFN